MTEFQKIADASKTSPVECSCHLCQSMCKRAPCIGTPDDIITLINNGYIHQLSLTTWSALKSIGMPDIDMVQITANKDNSCPLFENGLCSIHSIKPTEGKLANHYPVNVLYAKPPGAFVAMSWLDSDNMGKIRFIENALIKYLKL